MLQEQLDEGLALAAAGESVQEVYGYLLLGASPTAVVGGFSPLHYAASSKSLPIYQVLLRAGANANAAAEPDNVTGCASGATPLHMACCKNCSHGILKALLAVGAELEAADEYGLTALGYAAESGSTEAAVELLRRGARVTPGLLHMAALGGHMGVMRSLLASHAVDVNVTDKAGLPPLYAAASSGNAAAVQLLLENGADASAAVDGTNAVLFGLRAAVVRTANEEDPALLPKDWAAMARLPLEAGVPAAGCDSRGYAAANYAAMLSCAPLVRGLAEHGADMNVAVAAQGKPKSGLFALHIACVKCDLNVVEALLDCGASAHPGGSGGVQPPLLAAMEMAGTALGQPWRSRRGHSLAVRLTPEGALPDRLVRELLSSLGAKSREAVRQLALVAARQRQGQRLGSEELRRVALMLCIAVLTSPVVG